MSAIVKKKLLIVDDIELNRVLLEDLFYEQYDVIQASNGKEALDLIAEHQDNLAIVLLDLVMPVMDGFQVIKSMINMDLGSKIPVIMITSEDDDEKLLTGYALGVADLINKPFNSDIVVRRVSNTVALYAHKQELEDKLAEQRKLLEIQANRLRESNLFVVDVLSSAVEFRSFESGQHIKRVRLLTKILLEQLRKVYNLSEAEIEVISSASAMHDIGKIAITDAILLKPGPLTKEEFEIMKTHTTKGCELLNTLNYTQDDHIYQYSYDICRYHHERWDGRGYPDGLKGEEIPIWAHATALADVYDALTSVRVYKGAYTHDEAVDMILRGECGAFNPKLLESLERIRDILPEILEKIGGGNPI
ncbi:MAG: response regulator [Oscillospiraceae bacterium]|nr:response regulator [Oscillospiraceae bacterium]